MEIIKRYPYEVEIKKVRGASSYIIKDKARRIKRKSDNTEVMHLKNEKADFPIPNYEHIYSRRGGKPVIFLQSNSFGNYLPCKWEDYTDIAPVDKDIEFWHDMEVDRLHRTYQDKQSIWMMLLPLIGVLILFAALIITYILFGKTMISVAQSSAEAARYASEAANAAKGIAPLS